MITTSRGQFSRISGRWRVCKFFFCVSFVHLYFLLGSLYPGRWQIVWFHLMFSSRWPKLTACLTFNGVELIIAHRTIDSNNFTGEIPVTLGNATTLTRIDLGKYCDHCLHSSNGFVFLTTCLSLHPLWQWIFFYHYLKLTSCLTFVQHFKNDYRQ